MVVQRSLPRAEACPSQRTLVPPQAFLPPSTSNLLFLFTESSVKYTWDQGRGQLVLCTQLSRQLVQTVGRCFFLAHIAKDHLTGNLDLPHPTPRLREKLREERAPESRRRMLTTSSYSSSFPCLFPPSQEPLTPFGGSWGSRQTPTFLG